MTCPLSRHLASEERPFRPFVRFLISISIPHAKKRHRRGHVWTLSHVASSKAPELLRATGALPLLLNLSLLISQFDARNLHEISKENIARCLVFCKHMRASAQMSSFPSAIPPAKAKGLLHLPPSRTKPRAKISQTYLERRHWVHY